MSDIKKDLVDHLKKLGAFDVRVADPHRGFVHAAEGRHPLELWSGCRSIIVFAVACSPRANNTYIGTCSPWEGRKSPPWEPSDMPEAEYGMTRLIRLVLYALKLHGVLYLQGQGHGVSLSPQAQRLQLKLCAYEAGLGVYGRSGVILHPVLGNRVRFGAILTDQYIEPDTPLDDYAPCDGCSTCVDRCPGKAYDPALQYPESWSKEKCLQMRTKISEKGMYCHNCYAVCPAGTMDDKDLLRIDVARSFLKRDRFVSSDPAIVQ